MDDDAGDCFALDDLVAQVDQRKASGRELVGLFQHGERGVLLALAGEEAGIGLRGAKPGFGSGSAGGNVVDGRLIGSVGLVVQAGLLGDQALAVGDEQPVPVRPGQFVERRKGAVLVAGAESSPRRS